MVDCFVGEIRLFSGTFAPEGWAYCNGAVLPIAGNEALYTLLGVTYGGDGRTTFALPDLRSRLPLGVGVSPSNTATTYVVGGKGGAETVALTAAQLPAHTHSFNVSTADGNQTGPTNHYLADTPNNLPMYVPYASSNPTRILAAASISTEGGGSAHINVMRCTGMNYIIALNGIFPSQG